MCRCARPLLELCLLPALALGLTACVRAAEEPAENEEYEPPPAGYEERHYSIMDLIRVNTDFPAGAVIDPFVTPVTNVLTGEQIVDVIKYCVAPESWTRRGPARIQIGNGELVVLHKKEALDEIAKVLQFLADGANAPCRVTVLTAVLKPDALKKFVEAGIATPAELAKAVEDAGDGANAESVELRGVEGQRIAVSGTERRQYIKDYDVSGAVFDPVMDSLVTGLVVGARACRSPDAKSARVDLQITLARPATMEKAQIAIEGISVGEAPAPPAADKKEGEKKDQPPPPGALAPARFKSALQIDLPVQVQGHTSTTITVPRGMFALAGTLDFTLAGGKAPERVAVFVRADIGGDGVPTLQGVSGLKEGESFCLYPLLASAAGAQDYPGPDFQISLPGSALGAQQGGAGAGAVAAPFAAPALVAPTPTTSPLKAKQMFAEKVRKNKIVEAMGPFFFTRLTGDDHARLLKTLADDYQRGLAPLRLRAIAVAVPPAVYQKLTLGNTQAFDAAAIEALAAGPGAQLLADSCLRLLRSQRAFICGGRLRNVLTDYEISGDSYDPVVRQVLDQGYVCDARGWQTAAAQTAEVELRFTAVPGTATSDRTTVDAFSVNSGANVNLVLGVRADLDRLKAGVIAVRGNARVPMGKFVLAGAAHMPPGPDGKPDPRQAVVFVGADAAP